MCTDGLNRDIRRNKSITNQSMDSLFAVASVRSCSTRPTVLFCDMAMSAGSKPIRSRRKYPRAISKVSSFNPCSDLNITSTRSASFPRNGMTLTNEFLRATLNRELHAATPTMPLHRYNPSVVHRSDDQRRNIATVSVGN